MTVEQGKAWYGRASIASNDRLETRCKVEEHYCRQA